jgi:6-phosphogluconate dehydrogenase (decarboxylating)
VGETIADLLPLLEPGDILIDGGNSYYIDDIRRAKELAPKGIHYVDVGTSGGVWGLERGYCMMIGGEKEVVQRLDPIFATLAPGIGEIPRTAGREENQGTAEQGYLHCGANGAGHFVTMVHNGIEYGIMAAYAEGLGVLRSASSPQGHWHTTTMICSIRLDGSTACMTIEGATDAEVFRAYVRRVLCPTLRKGDVVIMDNLSPHKSELTLSLIEQAGAEVLFLPAYSPDLNPIEKMWSKIKACLRSAQARTQPALIQAIALALASVTRQDAMNWFASCGYSFI